MNVPESKIKDLMKAYKKICVYGLSPDPTKPSHYVPLYMKNQGWDVVGIYPKNHPTNEFPIYSSLAEVPSEYRKFLNVFRSSEKIPELATEILKYKDIEVVWLQLGIHHSQAEQLLEDAGLQVVSNRCLIIEHKKL